ncbi:MAG: hypothetical protein HZC01_03420 [Candidatus Kerfeldbacteria bacterium]|nr:hypothetical protein [Candidatus Kerfeldbacteria bacterium]
MLLLAFWLGSVTLATALDVNISAVVEESIPEQQDTIIQFSGLAYPSGAVTVRQDGVILTTTTADSAASFSTSSIVTSGAHTYALTAVDSQNRTGSATSYTLNLSQGATVTVSNIFLGPTVAVSASSITADQSVNSLGITAPNSTVTVYVTSSYTGGGSDSREFQVVADGSGIWTRQFTGTTLGVGSHVVRARATSSSLTSSYSNSLVIAVDQANPCATSTPGDINCDGSVDLVDFSILLYYWNTTNPAQARTDINGDTTVNVVDFSILLYYWTG